MAIGEFLGGPSAAEVATLRAYARLFDLAGLRVDVALRVFLASFALPGEAQKIDRVVEAFAAAYFEQQQRQASHGGPPPATPTADLSSPAAAGSCAPCGAGEGGWAFRSADGVYVLAFSLVMLNTDLHSAHVKDKMRFGPLPPHH